MSSTPRARTNDDLVERAHLAIDRGDPRRAQRLLKSLDEGATKGGRVDVAYLRWRLASLDEDPAAALKVAEANADSFPDSPEVQHALGWSLLDANRAEEAIPWLEEACYLDPDFGDAWHDLAIARELIGDIAGMRQAFAEVHSIDTAEPRPPLHFTPEQVQKWAQRAFDLLPADIQERVADVPVFVADYPDAWILEDAPWDPRLLGLFDGPTWAERKRGDFVGAPHIYLYQRNLEQLCGNDPRAMATEVRVTVHHEIGHFLGLDEEDLHARGLG